MGDSGLDAQSPQVLLHGPVVDVREKERGIDVALFDVSNEVRRISDTGVSDAMLPDRIHKLRNLARHPGQVRIQIAIKVGFEHQVTRLEMFFACRRAYIDYVIHYHQPREVGAVYLGEGVL